MSSMLRHLVSLLETEFEVVSTAENGKLALECIRRYAPDVAVLDLRMPILNGIEVTREARKLAPSPAIVICSVESDPDIIEAAKRAGALGYVLKLHANRDLITAVKSVAHGKSFPPHNRANNMNIAELFVPFSSTMNRDNPAEMTNGEKPRGTLRRLALQATDSWEKNIPRKEGEN